MANRSFHILVAVVVLSSAHGISPAQDVQNTLLTFRALGDVPYSEAEYSQLARHVADLQPSAAFVVHVGDIKSGSSPCEEAVYERVAGILRESRPPLFIIPGDNEWNDCQNITPDEAWGFWTEHFQRFEEHWSHELDVVRQSARDENFAFVASNVLITGINLVGGRVQDNNEWQQRMTDDANWIREQFETYRDQVTHAVVFAHAFADGDRRQFADEFITAAEEFGNPVLYLQGDTHSWVQDQPFTTAPNVTRVVVDSGGVPPVQVTVTDDPNNPFLFDRNPFVPLVLDGGGTTYSQNFDLLGQGGRGTNLPAGWKATTDDGTKTEIDQSVVRRIRAEVYNAGHRQPDLRADRALATGNTASDQQNALELHAEVRNADVRAWRLSFDVEAWGADPAISSTPAEAVFDVALEIMTGDGFSSIRQFGKVGTGATLMPPAQAGLVDGNEPTNRISFDSGVQEITIPDDSRIRIFWDAQDQGQTAGWVFGLDNVVLRVARPGDADVDGDVNFSDFLVLANHFGMPGGWRDGDFDKSGQVQFPDFVILANSFGQSPSTTTAAVPEPSGVALLLLGPVGVLLRRRGAPSTAGWYRN